MHQLLQQLVSYDTEICHMGHIGWYKAWGVKWERGRESEVGGDRESEKVGRERERQKEREFHTLLKQVRFMDTLGKCFYRKERLKPLSLLLFFVFFLFSFADIGRALQALHWFRFLSRFHVPSNSLCISVLRRNSVLHALKKEDKILYLRGY